jgi:hypothetical protein
VENHWRYEMFHARLDKTLPHVYSVLVRTQYDPAQ